MPSGLNSFLAIVMAPRGLFRVGYGRGRISFHAATLSSLSSPRATIFSSSQATAATAPSPPPWRAHPDVALPMSNVMANVGPTYPTVKRPSRFARAALHTKMSRRLAVQQTITIIMSCYSGRTAVRPE
jgi:hypothetical protein